MNWGVSKRGKGGGGVNIMHCIYLNRTSTFVLDVTCLGITLYSCVV